MGFSAGQVQYLDLIKKDTSKLFNEEVIAAPRTPNCSAFSPTHYMPLGCSCLGNSVGLREAGPGRDGEWGDSS